MLDVRRRDFITLFGSAAAVRPLAALAQQPERMPVIGFLNPGSSAPLANIVAGLRHGLSEGGFVEGENVAIEYRWADGQADRLPAMAADLVRRQVAVIIAGGGTVTTARAATATIPILFTTGVDPVRQGFVASLNRPGGNVTGAFFYTIALGPKRLELLHEAVPAASVIGFLVNPNLPYAEVGVRDLEAAARAMGQQVRVLRAASEREFDAAFATLSEQRIGALVVGGDPFFNSRRDQLVALATRHAVPAIYENREFAAAGGLMSYGADVADAYRQVGVYAGRVLKGEKPADLPVVQSTKVEFVINLKAAKALGLTFPLPLIGRADEVIE
jgi:putative ABC transport system substrate-binding protein